jgi:hypothetical protein
VQVDRNIVVENSISVIVVNHQRSEGLQAVRPLPLSHVRERGREDLPVDSSPKKAQCRGDLCPGEWG